MRVLLDENIPHKLRSLLPEHDVSTVAYLNWVGVKNGELLRAMEDAGFDVLITSDQGIPYQQKTAGRRFAVVMLSTPGWNMLRTAVANIAAAIAEAVPGSSTPVDRGTFSRRKPNPEYR